MYAGKGLDLRVKDLKNEFWLNSEQKQFLKDTKARLGTIKILNVNPKNPKDHICVEEEKAILHLLLELVDSHLYIFFCFAYYMDILQSSNRKRN